MYKVIQKHTNEEDGVELRLAQISTGFIVGVWDLDVDKYYSGIRLFPNELEDAQDKARRFFEESAAIN